MSIHRDRRRFTVAFKLQIIEESARCVAPGALLHREGLYSTHLSVRGGDGRRGCGRNTTGC